MDRGCDGHHSTGADITETSEDESKSKGIRSKSKGIRTLFIAVPAEKFC
jgi:hypothetical protein